MMMKLEQKQLMIKTILLGKKKNEAERLQIMLWKTLE